MAKEIYLEKLARFLVKAKTETYATGIESNITPQRPGFDELEFVDGEWNYRDSYCGFYRAPGQEIVRFEGNPVWCMSYDGGMLPEFRSDIEFAEKTFKFLQKALLKIEVVKPFRGPSRFEEGDYQYFMEVEGGIEDFKGTEKILFKGKVVFIQNFMGGLIIDKEESL